MTSVLTRPDLAGTLVEQLAQAPIGRHALHEAALLWSASRPAGWRHLGPPTPRRHITISRVPSAAPAYRATRLLSGLTWAVVDDGPAGSFDVAVAATDWHRIIRCLTATRREAANLIAVRRHPELAAAAWRVAILGFVKELDADCLTVHVRDRGLREVLLIAAPVLDVEPHCYESFLTVNGRHNVLRLLDILKG